MATSVPRLHYDNMIQNIYQQKKVHKKTPTTIVSWVRNEIGTTSTTTTTPTNMREKKFKRKSMRSESNQHNTTVCLLALQV